MWPYSAFQGYCHMDVAARNALLHTNNLVKLSDFGIVSFPMLPAIPQSHRDSILTHYCHPDVVSFPRHVQWTRRQESFGCKGSYGWPCDGWRRRRSGSTRFSSQVSFLSLLPTFCTSPDPVCLTLFVCVFHLTWSLQKRPTCTPSACSCGRFRGESLAPSLQALHQRVVVVYVFARRSRQLWNPLLDGCFFSPA